MDPLAHLSELLRQANTQGAVSMRPCAEIAKVHAELERRVRSGGANYEPQDLQIEAVRRFWDTREFESFREARLVAFGLAVRPWENRQCLMEDPERFGAVLTGLRDWEPSPRQFRKCYQGLVRSYFDYDGLGRDIPPAGRSNWHQLQAYLRDKAGLINDSTMNPDWVGCIGDNKELFSENPCRKYAQEMLGGRDEKVIRIRELLGISDASWFTRELVLSQIAWVCKLDHDAFTSELERMLTLLAGNEVLRDRGLQMVLERYAKIPLPPQHTGLKDFSVNAWGNPWLPSNEHRWGGVSEGTRNMIGDWLKLEFIELFFTKLAQDGLSDTRRVSFWAQYVPLIENIHFALGTHAMTSQERDFVELRTKLKGLTVSLEDSRPFNNAFVMKMGDLVAVEFSGESNAFYGYSVARTLPFDLSRPVRSAPVDGRNSLKNSDRVLYMRHQDNVHGYPDWEDRFKRELHDKFDLLPERQPARRILAQPAPTTFPPQTQQGARPPRTTPQAEASEQSLIPPSFLSQREWVVREPAAPARQLARQTTRSGPDRRSLLPENAETYSEENVRRLAERFKATLIDNRGKGGALWLKMDGATGARPILNAWGFRYVEGKGWYKTDAE